MYFKFLLFFCALWLAIKVPEISARVEFTNIKCDPLDKSFVDFEYCYIKAVNRTYKYISVKVNLIQVPITKVKLNISLMKRFHGYLPFLFNVTFDFCQHMKNRERNPTAKFLLDLFLPFSNINHTCPYDHAIIVDKLPISYVNNQVTKVLPFPPGDYAFLTNWMVYDINRAEVKAYMTLS